MSTQTHTHTLPSVQFDLWNSFSLYSLLAPSSVGWSSGTSLRDPSSAWHKPLRCTRHVFGDPVLSRVQHCSQASPRIIEALLVRSDPRLSLTMNPYRYIYYTSSWHRRTEQLFYIQHIHETLFLLTALNWGFRKTSLVLCVKLFKSSWLYVCICIYVITSNTFLSVYH